MLSISVAKSDSDFEAAAEFAREFGEWDVVQAKPYGITRDELLLQFHSHTAPGLKARFAADDIGKLLLAKWNMEPAGTLAFEVFDDAAIEIQHFYVSPNFRSKGIGRALMQSVLSEIGDGDRRTVLLHTTPYMTDAIAVYEAFGFAECGRFRHTPESIRQTDYFMSRTI